MASANTTKEVTTDKAENAETRAQSEKPAATITNTRVNREAYVDPNLVQYGSKNNFAKLKRKIIQDANVEIGDVAYCLTHLKYPRHMHEEIQEQKKIIEDLEAEIKELDKIKSPGAAAKREDLAAEKENLKNYNKERVRMQALDSSKKLKRPLYLLVVEKTLCSVVTSGERRQWIQRCGICILPDLTVENHYESTSLNPLSSLTPLVPVATLQRVFSTTVV